MTTCCSRLLCVSVFVVLLGGLSGPVRAQIVTDRPGFADGAVTVAERTVQAEMGYAFRGNGSSAHDVGQLLIRAGITESLELRGRVGSYTVTEGEEGYDGAALGAKLNVLDTRAAALGAMATTTLPIGTAPGASDRVRQEVKFALDAALAEGVALSVNSGVRVYYSSGIQDERAPEGLFLGALGGTLSESVVVFVGYGGFYGKVANRSWLEGGLTVLANPDTQLDANVGLRVDGNVDSAFFVGVGLARRL